MKTNKALRLTLLSVSTFLLANTVAHAQTPPLTVPEPLAPWVEWVKYELSDIDCARIDGGGRECVWPGELKLEVKETSASFRLTASLDKTAFLRLPGDASYWPQKVKNDRGQPLLVQKHGDTPGVVLPAGSHIVEGTFAWPSTPEFLKISPHTGQLRVTFLGRELPSPRVDVEGRLWLQDGTSTNTEALETDSLKVAIYRKIEDGIPLRIVTRLDLKVSGRARDVNLKQVLLPGGRPIAIKSQLPTQMLTEGSLKVYAKPGTHTVEITSISTDNALTWTVPKHDEEVFEPQEVWLWIPNEKFRSVEYSGLQVVDPERTSLPREWYGNTTFLAEAGATLKLTETRRGEAEYAPNELNLQREFWLDIDGTGYTVRDKIRGTMNQKWRLDYSDNGELGRVSDKGSDLLITKNDQSKKNGVEIRNSKLHLLADLRINNSQKRLKIVGWEHDVQSLKAVINLPPGWTLLGASGVDSMSGGWLSSWTLFDFFMVLMVALAVGKLCGWPWMIVAILGLGLSHDQPMVPKQTWVHVVASLALLRVVPDGVFRQLALGYRALSLFCLVVLLGDFSEPQLRFALFPQASSTGMARVYPLAEQYEFTDAEGDGFGDLGAKGTGAGGGGLIGALAPQKENKRSMSEKKSKRGRYTDYNVRKYQIQQVDPNAIVQTGPGVPRWSWKSWHLFWSGPVQKDHEVELWLLSPLVSRVLSVVRVFLLLLLAGILFRIREMGLKANEPFQIENFLGSSTSSVLVLMFAGGLFFSKEAQAEPFPLQNQENVEHVRPINGSHSLEPMLDELKRRIRLDSECRGTCVVANQMEINVTGAEWNMTVELHAQKDSLWRLPGPSKALLPRRILLNGKETRQIRREAGGLFVLRHPEGTHKVSVEAQLPNKNVITVQLDNQTPPQFVRFTSEDWSVDGISETGIPDNSLQLTRKTQTNETDKQSGSGTELPPWFTIDRDLALGLPWQITTIVRRLDAERPQLLKVPLIADEKIISEQTRVEDGLVLVDFPRGVYQVEYVSELPITPQISLKMPSEKPWSETWRVECSRIWRCNFEGIASIRSIDNQKNYHRMYKPWPSESLTIDILRPSGAPGQGSTVDEVRYDIVPGKRLLEGKLSMSIRASQGGWQKVTLPKGAQLQTVTESDSVRNIRPQNGIVNLPLKPGKQTYVLRWQQKWDRNFGESMPEIDIGSDAVNSNLTITVGPDRWLLWTNGPDWGPAVLFWSYLVFLLICAIILGQIRQLPIKHYEWFLLLLGLSQLSFVSLFPILGWFALLAWRRTIPTKSAWKANFLQLVICGASFVALAILFHAVRSNLIFNVDMQVVGAQSTSETLRWYSDKVGSKLPNAQIYSVPVLAWRLVMLGWALWLANKLLKWVPWAWSCFSSGGIWQKLPVKSQKPPQKQVKLDPVAVNGGADDILIEDVGLVPGPPDGEK
ncbi:MAG: hypothetical protein VYC39_08965 [Myxococcota bacterium]|nr:hypothetical protein [Myxococcota bacterium]